VRVTCSVRPIVLTSIHLAPGAECRRGACAYCNFVALSCRIFAILFVVASACSCGAEGQLERTDKGFSVVASGIDSGLEPNVATAYAFKNQYSMEKYWPNAITLRETAALFIDGPVIGVFMGASGGSAAVETRSVSINRDTGHAVVAVDAIELSSDCSSIAVITYPYQILRTRGVGLSALEGPLRIEVNPQIRNC